jgi:hypothetical protein
MDIYLHIANDEITDCNPSLVSPACNMLADRIGACVFTTAHLADLTSFQDRGSHARACLQVYRSRINVPIQDLRKVISLDDQLVQRKL